MRQSFLESAARFGDVPDIAAQDLSPRSRRVIGTVSLRASVGSPDSWVGTEISVGFGHDTARIDALSSQATEFFVDVDNPLDLDRMRAVEDVLDLGCGAGMESLLTARRVGPTACVIGEDMTVPMVEKARANASAIKVGNAEFRPAEADRLPVVNTLSRKKLRSRDRVTDSCYPRFTQTMYQLSSMS